MVQQSILEEPCGPAPRRRALAPVMTADHASARSEVLAYPVGQHVEAVDHRLALLAAIRRAPSKRWSLPREQGPTDKYWARQRAPAPRECSPRSWSVKTPGETLALVARSRLGV